MFLFGISLLRYICHFHLLQSWRHQSIHIFTLCTDQPQEHHTYFTSRTDALNTSHTPAAAFEGPAPAPAPAPGAVAPAAREPPAIPPRAPGATPAPPVA